MTQVLTWENTVGERHVIVCDWEGCNVGAMRYVKLDTPIGPYDKAALCPEHANRWRNEKNGRQDNIDKSTFWMTHGRTNVR